MTRFPEHRLPQIVAGLLVFRLVACSQGSDNSAHQEQGGAQGQGGQAQAGEAGQSAVGQAAQNGVIPSTSGGLPAGCYAQPCGGNGGGGYGGTTSGGLPYGGAGTGAGGCVAPPPTTSGGLPFAPYCEADADLIVYSIPIGTAGFSGILPCGGQSCEQSGSRPRCLADQYGVEPYRFCRQDADCTDVSYCPSENSSEIYRLSQGKCGGPLSHCETNGTYSYFDGRCTWDTSTPMPCENGTGCFSTPTQCNGDSCDTSACVPAPTDAGTNVPDTQ
jgi:hypothetical protein